MNNHHQHYYSFKEESKGLQETAPDNFYDLQNCHRQYMELMEENLWLKQMIEQNKHPKVHSHSQFKRTHKDNKHYHPKIEGESVQLPLWSMVERNRYLEEKLHKLRHQYEKQHQSINNILSSSKWKSKQKCESKNCYHNKYMQLLKVKSPFY